MNNHDDQSKNSKNADQNSALFEVYPKEFRDAEEGYLKDRRGCIGEKIAEGKEEELRSIGFALSGGGIRSATFCLGVFQGLAHLKLLRRIDYLSTVSGGGYFGAFLGRLYTRFAKSDNATAVKDAPALVEELLSPPVIDQKRQERRKEALGRAEIDPIEALRRNGRYLAPQGSGDVLLGFAVFIRNWFAIHVVLFTFFLAAFLGTQLIRAALENGLREGQPPSWAPAIESYSCLTCYLP